MNMMTNQSILRYSDFVNSYNPSIVGGNIAIQLFLRTSYLSIFNLTTSIETFIIDQHKYKFNNVHNTDSLQTYFASR